MPARPKLPPGPGRPPGPPAERTVPCNFRLPPEVDGLLTAYADAAFQGNRSAALKVLILTGTAGLEPTYRPGRTARSRHPKRTRTQ
jgi:hypothetical protein